MFVFFDDEIIAADQVKLDLTNRSFRYGDGLFETIRMFNYELPYLEKHLNRLEQGCKVLDLVLEKGFRKKIQEHLTKLAEKNQTPNARLRLMVYRKGGGLYTPETNNVAIFIECKKLETESFVWNEKGLKLGIYRDMKIQPSIISPYKTNNCLPYILAAIYKKKNNLDECVLLNESNAIADCISSNIFIVKDNQIITPKISDGGVAGTMRSISIEALKRKISRFKKNPSQKMTFLQQTKFSLPMRFGGFSQSIPYWRKNILWRERERYMKFYRKF